MIRTKGPKWLPAVCQVKGCENKYHSAGMCITHRGRWKRLGNPFAIVKPQVKSRTGICTVAGCSRKHVGRGLCSLHYTRQTDRKVYAKRWNAANRQASVGYNALRRALKAQAKPAWLPKEKLTSVYRNCPEGYEVDHIIPLNHPDVCGLHVPWNLQYLTPEENRSKGNKYPGQAKNRKRSRCK